MKFSFSAKGFLLNSEYLSEIPSCVELYTTDIKGINELKINLIETFPYLKHKNNYPSIQYEENGTKCIVKVTAFKTRNKKDQYKESPSPQSVYSTLIGLLKQLNKEHQVMFPQLYAEQNDTNKDTENS